MHDTDPLLTDEHEVITDRTRRNYEAAWRRYADWCQAEGLDPLDGDVDQIRAWLVAMYRSGIKPGTLKLWRIAIGHHYRNDPALADQPNPAAHKRVGSLLKRITIEAADAGVTTTSANAMTRDVLERVLAVSAERRACESEEQARRRHAEMSALLPLMFDGCLRADEAVRARWDHLSTTPHPVSGHYQLAIPKSKTDQEGKGSHAFVSRETYQALQRWRSHPDADAEQISTAPSANALAGRIRRLGEIAGVKLSGHSARRGAATELRHNGGTERDLKAAGRWSRSDTVNRYIEEADAANGGMAKLYGNGHDEPEPDEIPLDPDDPQSDRDARVWEAKKQLQVVVELDAARRPEDRAAIIEDLRSFIRSARSEDLPPALDCDRPGCPGLVLTANPRPGERYCSTRCQQVVRSDRRRAERQAERETR